MLVLGRKAGQKIQLGQGKNAITLTLVKLNGAVARIGIEAPDHVLVLRHELLNEPPSQAEGEPVPVAPAA
jgi:carbon storage regulator